MAHRKVEVEIERLSGVEDPAALRKALGDRVNLIAAKAAKRIAQLALRELIPDLLRAFERWFENDTQCWAKNAISQGLVDLDFRESAPFVRGAKHVQMEAAYGGPVDTAVQLRGICLLALPPCTDLTRLEVMRHLVDAMVDKAHPVRVDAARGLELMEGEGALLLRLKARMGDEEPAVTGQVFDSLLKLERDQAVPLVAEFLTAALEVKAEAALALGTSRIPAAVEILLKTFDTARETEFRGVILRALSLSRQDKAIAFLEDLVKNGRAADARAAREALDLCRKQSTGEQRSDGCDHPNG